MNAMSKFSRFLFGTPVKVAPPVHAERPTPRKMTGFFAQLTDEQKKKALEYTGDESHGEPDLLAARKLAA